MSNEDYCVYARNILFRLDQISNPTTGFTSDIVTHTNNTPSQSEFNIGLLVTIGMILLYIFARFASRRQSQPKSVLDSN